MRYLTDKEYYGSNYEVSESPYWIRIKVSGKLDQDIMIPTELITDIEKLMSYKKDNNEKH